MDNNTKRILLYWLGCIPIRLSFVALAMYSVDYKIYNIPILKVMGFIALIMGLGFWIIFLTNSRQEPEETFGGTAWWNCLRPIHGTLYLLFFILTWVKPESAYLPLLIDVIIGIFAWLTIRK